MTLHAVARKALVTGVKLKKHPDLGPGVEVAAAFRVRDLTEAERSTLHDYYLNLVNVELAAIHRDADETPMDRAMRERENGHHPERMLPGPDESCATCGKVIGVDGDAGFHVPPAGPPSPLCGACYQAEEDQRIAAEQAEPEDPERGEEPQEVAPRGRRGR